MPTKKTKGHWPKGKRRNPDTGAWSKTRLRLSDLLNDQPQRGRISIRKLANDLSVSDKTVRRWLNGRCRPEPESQRLVSEWIDDVKKSLLRVRN